MSSKLKLSDARVVIVEEDPKVFDGLGVWMVIAE
jgi:hypothetical protein